MKVKVSLEKDINGYWVAEFDNSDGYTLSNGNLNILIEQVKTTISCIMPEITDCTIEFNIKE